MVDGRYMCSIIYTDEATGNSLRHNGELYMYQQDGMLKGIMFPTFFWLSTPFIGGVVDGNRFTFTANWATPCQQFSMDVNGEVNGDVVAGICKTDVGNYILTGRRKEK